MEKLTYYKFSKEILIAGRDEESAIENFQTAIDEGNFFELTDASEWDVEKTNQIVEI